jgi:hypothetical protein
MAKTITLVQGDTAGDIEIPFLENADGPLALTGGETVTAQIREITSGQVIAVTTQVVAPMVKLPAAQRSAWPAGTWELRLFVTYLGSPAPVDVFPSQDKRIIEILAAWPAPA